MRALSYGEEKTSPKEVNKTQNKILKMITEKPEITQKELAEHLGITVRAVKLSMKNLEEMKIIRREGTARKGKWSRV